MELPIEKQTTLGLYVTSQETYDQWKEAPEKIKILDVRTFDEYLNIGHAGMAWNIPAFFQTTHWDEEKHQYSIIPNPDFMKLVNEVFTTDDTIYVTCRSGGRSAWAVNQLAAAGFKKVYNIIDGFEGDTVTDKNSPHVGKRIVNGWKNSDIPWTYEISPDLVKTQAEKQS